MMGNGEYILLYHTKLFCRIIVLLLPTCFPFFLLAQSLEPTETNALLKVSVCSMKGIPRPGEKVMFMGEKNKKIFSGVTAADGKFDILIPKGDTYDVKYRIINGDVDYKKFSIPTEEGLFTYEYILKYDLPRTVTLDNVFFDTGKSSLRPESYTALETLLEVMKLKPSLVIEIAGHTDNVGTSESNMILSLNRANSVKGYLVKKGIASERILTKGYGDTQPVADNETDESRQKNRRTKVRIVEE